jgi:hypothetical protein
MKQAGTFPQMDAMLSSDLDARAFYVIIAFGRCLEEKNSAER